MTYRSTLHTEEKERLLPITNLPYESAKRTDRYRYLLRKHRKGVQLDFLLNKSEATPKEFTWFCHTSSIDILEKIGYALMLQRYDRQITQKGLAKIMNTSPTVISKVENGKQNITFEYLTRFATALELPIRLEFLEGYTPFCIDIPCTYCKSPATGIELLKRFKDSASLEKQF